MINVPEIIFNNDSKNLEDFIKYADSTVAKMRISTKPKFNLSWLKYNGHVISETREPINVLVNYLI